MQSKMRSFPSTRVQLTVSHAGFEDHSEGDFLGIAK